MKIILLIVLLVYAVYLLRKSNRAGDRVTNSKSFFSFGADLDSSSLKRAFETTNATFTTSFVTLFLFSFVYGLYAFIIPLSFCIGIIFYALYLLPKQLVLFKKNERYPELLGASSNSIAIRKIVSLAVCFSLFVFTFAELQGFQLFLVKLLGDEPLGAVLIPLGLIFLIAIYTSQSGYRAVISNDRIQLNLIRLGSVAILGLVAYAMVRTLDGRPLNEFLEVFKLSFSPIGLSSAGAITLFVIETLVGFLFSQFLYYDNWQRLSFYVSERSRNGMSPIILLANIRSNYLKGSVELFFIYTVPIVLGFSLRSVGEQGSIDTLAAFFVHSWSNIPIPLVGPIAVILALLFMVNALVSTAEVYIVGIVNSVMEDILGLIDGKSPEDNNAEVDKRHLYGARMLTFLVCMAFLPLVLIQPNFEQLFNYMFYSANGLVGPLTMAVLGKAQSPRVILACVGFGLIYPAVPSLWPTLGEFTPFPGFVTVAVSLGLSLFVRRGIKQNA